METVYKKPSFKKSLRPFMGEQLPFLYNLWRYLYLQQKRYPGYFFYANRFAKKIRFDHNLSNEKVHLPEKKFLTVMAMMRGEERSLVEWVEFHRLMGVEHFILYDNGNYDLSRKILAQQIAEGVVTLVPFPDIYDDRLRKRHGLWKMQSMQSLTYGDFLVRYRHNTTWALKIDLDEYVYPLKGSGYETIIDYLQEVDKNDAYMEIRVPSIRFGSCAHVEPPDDLVIASYDMRYPTVDRSKSMGKTKYMLHRYYNTAHDYHYHICGKKRIFEDKVLMLNHYDLKSKKEYFRKKKINSKGYLAGKENEKRFELINSRCTTKDNLGIKRFLPTLRQRLALLDYVLYDLGDFDDIMV